MQECFFFAMQLTGMASSVRLRLVNTTHDNRLVSVALGALFAVALAVAVAWFCWLRTPVVRLDIGALSDTAYLRGFHERQADAGLSYRWSGPSAALRLPSLGATTLLELAIAGAPAGGPVTIAAADRPLLTIPLDPERQRRYRLLVPAPQPATGWHRLAITGVGVSSEADPRPLVARISEVRLLAPAGLRLPPLLPLVQLAGLAIVFVAFLGASGLPWRVAAPLGSAVGAALGAAWGTQPLWVGPYLAPILLAGAVIASTLALLRPAVVRSTLPAELRLLAILAACSALLPLYRFLAAGWESWLHWRNLPILLLPAAFWLLIAPSLRLRRLALGLLLVLSGGYALGMLGDALSRDYGRDFHALYRAVGRFFFEGGPLYDLPLLADNPLTDTFKYPPTFGALIAPFASMSFVAAFVSWRLLNLGLLVVSVLLLLRAGRAPLRSWAGAGLLLLVFSHEAIYDTLRHGQVDLILLALAAAALLSSVNNRDALSGAWLGLAAAVKLYPAFLLLPALVRGRWAAILGATGAGLAALALSLAIFGWEPHRQFLAAVLPATGASTGWVENQTFNGWLNRLLAPESVALEPDGGWLRGPSYLWAAVVTLLTAWLLRPSVGLGPLPAFGLASTAMLLALPTAWTHYQTVLLIPLWALLVAAKHEPERLIWPVAASAGLAWMLIAFGNAWTFFDRGLYGPFWLLLLSYKFYGALLLYASLALFALVGTRTANARSATAVRAAQAAAEGSL